MKDQETTNDMRSECKQSNSTKIDKGVPKLPLEILICLFTTCGNLEGY